MRRRSPPRSIERAAVRPPRTGWWLVGAVGFAAAFGSFAWGELVSGYATSSGFLVVPVLVLLTVPLLRLEAARNLVFDGAGIIFTALAVRCLGVFGRLYMIEDLYSGSSDSNGYDLFGRRLAARYIRLDFDVDPEKPIPGTGFLRVVTGIVYAFVGSDKFAGFLVFGFLAFFGTYLLYRAFVIAMPDGDHRRFALLVFFWPSLVFWPSSIGKEAWVLLCMGLASWGMARLVTRGRLGYIALGLGVLGLYAVRPHVAILFVAAAAVAVVMALLFSAGDPVKSFGFASKAVAVGALVVMGSVLAPQVADFLDVDDLGRSSIGEALAETEAQTSQGGSNFEAASVDSVLDYPWALVTVLLRPFPNEATNAQSVMSAAEGLLLVFLVASSFRALRRVPIEFVKRPYVAFAASYVLMFAYVFASIGNFGILVRQRTQVLPMLFVFVALPLSERSRAKRGERRNLERQVSESPTDASSRLNIVTTGLGPPRHS